MFDTFRTRLRRYHPRWDQFLFGLSLVGVLVVTHLYIQQGREFDRGCFGFSSLDGGQAAFDCSAVVSSGASTLLGVSNIMWGLGFYLAIAALTFGIFYASDRFRSWLHGARVAGLTGGLLYSGYLVYVQVEIVDALCAPCLASAAVVTLLFGVQVALLSMNFQSSESTMTSRLFKRDLTVYIYLAAFTTVLVGADLTYFKAVASSSEARDAAYQKQFDGAACQLDPEKEPVGEQGATLVQFQDVTRGPSDAPVTVIEYFDPNCPHCKTFHDTMTSLVDQYEDEVRFVFKPFPLRGSSLPEIQALYIANEEDKFVEMLEAQYARQDRTGITEEDLQAIASEIGMNADALLSRIQQNEYRNQIIDARRQAIDAGVDSTPTVLVNGRFVGSRSLECMEIFIERAQKGTLGQSDSR